MNGLPQLRTLVVGAGGYIGRHLVSKLGGAVHAVSSSDGAFNAQGLLNVDALTSAGSVDAVVYLSQSPRYRDVPQAADHLWSVNVVSPIRAAEWARHHGARRFIYASSGTVYVPSFAAHREDESVRRDHWYALSKVHAEEALACFQRDLDVTSVRLFGVYGPAQRDKLVPNLIDGIRAGRPVLLQPHPHDAADADGMRLSLIHVDDVTEVLAGLLTHGGDALVNVASTEVLSIRQIATAIGDTLQRPPVFSIAATPRDGDVIADTARLQGIMPRTYRPFASAIGAVVEPPPNAQ